MSACSRTGRSASRRCDGADAGAARTGLQRLQFSPLRPTASRSPGAVSAAPGEGRGYLANPPKWRMFGFSCNNFAASGRGRGATRGGGQRSLHSPISTPTSGERRRLRPRRKAQDEPRQPKSIAPVLALLLYRHPVQRAAPVDHADRRAVRAVFEAHEARRIAAVGSAQRAVERLQLVD